jgi:FkbM family methyltransferase
MRFFNVKQIFEKLSWLPYEFKYRAKKNIQKTITLDLSKIGIPEVFYFDTVGDDQGLSKQLDLFRFREPLNWREYYKFINERDVVLDIGGNIGMFALLSSKAKKVHSIEPIKTAIDKFNRNIKQNGLTKKINVTFGAVGHKGKLFLKVGTHLNMSHIVNEKSENTVEVPSNSLHYFVNKFNTNLVRMDLEGYEYEVLYKKIPLEINKIALEYHFNILGREKTKKLMGYFEEENFIVESLIEDLPLRLYPFYSILKFTGLIKFFTYVKKRISPLDACELIFKGRGIKYLLLKRKIQETS